MKKYHYRIDQHKEVSTTWVEQRLAEMREKGWVTVSVCVTGTTTVITYETWKKERRW